MNLLFRPPVRPVVEELEPRILYSGDLAPGLTLDAGMTAGAEVRPLDESEPGAGLTHIDAPESRAELIVVDTRVDDWQTLVAAIQDETAERQTEIVLLDAERDGIAQIGDILGLRRDIAAVHIISHGAPGYLELGASRLDAAALRDNAASLDAWRDALTEDADILIYGCDVASGEEGQTFLAGLSRHTGADVAASDDKTGGPVSGGDWSLEYRSGAVESTALFSAAAPVGWTGLLTVSAQGGETRANTATAGVQATNYADRSVAMDGSGNYVVVWQDLSGAAGDAGIGVYAQRYNASGAPQGGAIHVNTTTADNQSQPQVAMSSDGAFVVVWQSMGQDGSNLGIYAQRFDTAGAKSGGEFRVNQTTANDQKMPAVAMDASGNFVVTWTAWNQDLANTWGVYARRYDAGGTALSSEFKVNTYTTSDQDESAIGMDASGNFVIAWQSWVQDGDSAGIYAQRYNASGVAQGAEFRVNTTTADFQDLPSVSMNASGFVIAWESLQDGSGYGIYAQRYNASGAALGSETRLNGTTSGAQENPSVAMSPDGGFIAAWESNLQDGSLYGVYIRQFDADGAPLTPDTRVNTTTANDQLSASLAADSLGHVAVVWSGNGSGDADGVFTQRYAYTTSNAPTLDNARSPALDAQNEGDGVPSGAVGTLISSLVDFASPIGQIDNVTDPDPGALLGIAVIGADGANGAWWYSTNGGVSWSTLGAVADNNARLLAADSDTRLYFQANAGYSGILSSAITLRAWDQTSGSNGALADASSNGGATAFSSATDSASLLVSAAPSTSLIWNTFAGSSNNDYVESTFVDADGNIYVAGHGSATWGAPVRAFSTGDDAFVAKFDSGGNLIWNTFLGGSGIWDYANGITVDASGDVFVTGESSATWGAPVRAHTGGNDAFVAKLEGASGVLVWNTFLGSGSNDWSYGIAVDGSGSIYVGGASLGSWGTPVRTFTVSAGNADAFVAKLDGSGTLLWNTFLGGAGSDGVMDLALDGSGSVYVGGYSNAAWGTPVRAYSSGFDILAARLNATTGGLTWNSFMGGAGYEVSGGVALDASDNLYIAGNGDTTWGAPVQAFAGGLRDAIVVQVNSAGALNWNTFLGGPGTDEAYDAALIGTNVVVAGRSDATWGSPWNAYASGYDAFLSEFDSSGNRLANAFFGGAGNDESVGIATDGSGGIVLAGASTATWGDPVRAYSGLLDGMVTKISASLAGISITPTSGLVTTEAGATATFDVVLDSAPTADVSIGLTSSDSSEGTLSTSSLTFTTANWSTPQTVTITGVDDTWIDGSIGYSIITAAAASSDANYNNLNAGDVSVSNTDLDTYNTLIVDTTSDVNDTAQGASVTIAQLMANKGADGKVSLREAITAANNTVNGVGGADRIEFDITDALVGGAHTISLSADLPFIGEAVTLDASTEPDTGGAHVVVIDGASAAANGLEIRASNTHVHGLVLNGFTQRGILVNNGAANVLITGNYVGTDVTGLVARGNGSWGIDLIGAGSGTVIGGDTPAERNVIGAHLGQGGLAINNTQGVTVTGNYIGLGADGITALGNATGIFLINATTGTRIGGIAAGEGNHIAYNLGVGVEIASSNRISVLGNAIYDNGGLGIDLGWDGAVQPNDNGVGDSDIGANNLQNYPVLVSATGDGTDTTLIGTIDSTPDTNFRIEFFSSPSGDTSGYGEGQTYLGFAAVLTDGSGNAAFNTTFAGVSVADGHVVTATATVVNAGVFEDTSEFSAYVAATALNEAPVNSVPGPQSVNEDTPLVIGGISVSDANLASTRLTVSQGTLTVSLAGGASISAGANDSAALTLSGTPTQINEALLTLSYQGDADYNGADTLTVLATDGEGLTDSDTVEISVQPVNDAPLLSTGVSLPGINEDDVTNNGFLVSMLANVATDVDSGALQGLAVTSVDNAHGTWQYTLDGSSWLDIGAVSQTNARLLPSDATARIRFVPDANWNGLTGLFIYHAWDQSSGSAGDLADASVNGGATAFSFGTSGSALSVSPVNDAPLLADSGLEFTVLENSGAPVDGTAVGVPVSDFTGAITDADGAVARGIAIIYSNEADGTWYYTTNGGDNWLAIGTVSDASSLLLADTASTRLYFAPNIDYNGNVFPGLIIRAWDQSSGVAGAKVDTTANGGTTAFSSGIDTIDPTVTAANNAPVISLGAVNLLTNGSFESGGIGWTGNSGVEASATPGNYGIPAPPDGIVFVEVEGYALPAGTASYIEQTVATVVGQTYVVNLSTITRMTFNVQDQGALSINGVEIGQFTTGTTWQDYAASFTATSTSSTLRITSLGSASGLAPLEGDAGGLIVDDVQVVTLQTTAAFTENGAPVVMADAARAYDAELSALNNFDGARLTLARNGGANAEDIFTGSGVLNLSGSDVVLSGITIGTYTNSAGTFQITFNANASNTLVYQAMRQIAYSNSSDAPPASVQIDWTFDDGNTGAQGAGGARSVISSATIIITQQNDPPVLDAIGDQSVAEATQLSFTATATDPDVPPGSLSYSLGGSVPSGASIDADSGVFTWTPTEAQGPGSYTFDVRVSDGQGGSDSETITVTVNEGANQAPILDAIGNQTVTEGNPLTFTATASDADVPPDTLTYSLSGSVPAGAVIDANTGVFTWTPSEAQGPGVYTFDVLVSDGQGGSDSETIQVTVNEGANQAPILDAIGDRTVAEATQLSFTATASDADVPPETLTYSLSGSVPAGAVIDANTGVFTWTPSEAQGPGTYTFDVVVSDGQGGSDSEMITVTVSEGANQAPVLDAIGNQTVTEGNPLTFTATASDADVPPDTLTYSLSGSVPAGAVIDANTGVFTWIPSEAQGPGVYTFDVVVSDGSASDTETIQVTVSEGANQAPVLDAIGNQTVTEGNLLSFTATASDADVPPETLTYSLSGSVPAGAVIDANTGVFTWTPSEAQGPGTYTFDVVVSDGQGGSDSEMITVTVSEGANQAPVLDAIGNQTVTEGNPLTFTATASDADLPPDTLTYSLSGSVPAGAVIDANTGVFTWTPSEAQGPGVYTFDVVVSDGSASDTETIQVTVSEGANQAPVLDAIGNQTVTEGNLLSFTATASDADVPPETLTYSLSGSVPAGAVIDANTGVFTWTPSEAQGPGVYTFDVLVSDGQGGSDSEMITVTVSEGANQAPVLDAIGNQTVTEGNPLTFTATASDADVPPDTLTYSLSGSVPAGAVIDANTGVFTWTPSEAQGPGTYTFDVVVSDGQGGSDSEMITVTVSEGANQAPVLDAIGNQTVTEGNPLTFTATASDADLPPDTLTYSLSGSVPAGAVIDANTGVFTWTPSEAQGPGVYTFDVVVSDGSASDTETIQVTVSEGANQAPVLNAIGNQTVTEGNLLSFTATASDADVPPETLTYSLSGSVPAGAVIDANTGVFTWTPSEAQGPGVYTFDVLVSDGQGGSDSEMITVTVSEGANQAPVLDAIGNQTVTEGNPLTFTATASDADVPPDTLTYSLSGSVPAGAVIDANTGVFTWTPSEAQGPGVYTFDVVVSDGQGGSDSETIQVTVNEGANQAPVLDVIGNQTVTEGNPLTFTATASDADLPPDTLTYSLSGSVPAGAVIDANTGVFTWTPSEAQGPGVYTFDVVVSDGSASDTETIQVTVSEGANQAPVLDAIGNQTVTEGNLLSFTATASDADVPPETLTYSLSGSVPAGAVIDANTGVFTWTPSEAQGPGVYTFDVVVSDGQGGSDSETIQVTVNEGANQAPVLDVIGNQTVTEGNPLTFTATASDADLPPDTLTYSLSGSVPAGAVIDANTGVFTWTPSEAQGPGVYTFDVVVSDGSASDTETIQVTVSEGANQAPVLDAIGNQTVTEGNLLSFTATASDADVPPETLTYSLSGSVPAGAVIDANTGVFTWTPSEAQGPGTYTFDVVVSDGQGGSDSEMITVTVSEGANQAPVLDAIGNQTVTEGNPLTFTATASDADLPPDTLTYSLSGSVPAGAVIDANTGVFTWTPSEAQGPGTYTFDVVVSDGQGGSDSEMITVTVSEGANQAPVLDAIGNQTVTEGNPLTFTATASDADLPPDTLTYSLSGSVPAGAVIDANTGVFTWTPSEAQGPGVYTFDVVVSDGSASDTETIQVTVSEGANQAPVLDAIGNQTVTEGNLLSFTATATDADVPSSSLSYSLAGTVPSGASIDANSGVFTWTPTEAQGPGSYTFDVLVSDGQGGSDSETITVTVSEGANQAPVLDAIGDQSVAEGNVLSFTATATDADVPPGSLTYSLGGSVPSGASIDANSGVFTWTPTEAQGPGSYTFDVLVSDGQGGSDSETITVTVSEGTNQAPALDAIGDRTVAEGNVLSFTATAADPDVPPGSLSYSLGGSVPSGASIDANSGVFTWTPTEAQGPGSYTFDVLVSDGQGGSDSETITVTVSEGANQAPVLDAIGDRTIAEGNVLSFTASATDPDVPPGSLSYSLAGSVPSGASMTADGVFTWTPTEAQGPGSYTFDVLVSDGQGGSDSETITVTVSDGNSPPTISSDPVIVVVEGVTRVATLSAVDTDRPEQGLTYSLTGGADQGRFVLDAASGELRFLVAPDFENPEDADSDNRYEVIVGVSDGHGGTDSALLNVIVSNRDEPGLTPLVDVDELPNRISEDAQAGARVGVTARSTDPDGSARLVYALLDDAQGRFVIDPATGVVSASGVSLDYETESFHMITVEARGGDGSSAVLTLSIQIDNANDMMPELRIGLIDIDQGGSVDLDASMIDAADPDGDAWPLEFSISDVVAGHFESLAAPGVPVETFGLDALQAGRIRFVHDGSGVAPEFKVSVTDGRHVVGPDSAQIRFNPVNILPEEERRPKLPETPPPDPDDGAEATPPTDSGGVTEESETLGEEPMPVIADDAGGDMPGGLLNVTHPFISVVRQSRGMVVDMAVVATQASTNDGAASVQVSFLEQFRLDFINYASTDSGGSGQGFGAATGLLETQDEDAQSFGIVGDAVRLTGLAFSVGAVWWALRIGGLMASLFAMVPAWRQFDPLPILRHKAELNDAGKWLEEDISPDTRSGEGAEKTAESAHREKVAT